jgi:hypothetical protein
MMPLPRILHFAAVATAILGLAACGDSETAQASGMMRSRTRPPFRRWR